MLGYVNYYVPVALFTRAWIEIIHYNHNQKNADVALFTRAWIEIECDDLIDAAEASPSSRGRGLKYEYEHNGKPLKSSRPLHEGVD